MKQQDLDNIFTYHKPFGSQAARYEMLRDVAKNFANIINIHCPESREKSLAITHLQMVIMFANASIAIHEVEPPS